MYLQMTHIERSPRMTQRHRASWKRQGLSHTPTYALPPRNLARTEFISSENNSLRGMIHQISDLTLLVGHKMHPAQHQRTGLMHRRTKRVTTTGRLAKHEKESKQHDAAAAA